MDCLNQNRKSFQIYYTKLYKRNIKPNTWFALSNMNLLMRNYKNSMLLLHSREVFLTESPSAKSISGGDFIWMASNRYVQFDPAVIEQARQIDLRSYLQRYGPGNLKGSNCKIGTICKKYGTMEKGNSQCSTTVIYFNRIWGNFHFRYYEHGRWGKRNVWSLFLK